MITNINPETGIHYGILSAHEFDPEWLYDSLRTAYKCDGCPFNDPRKPPAECDHCENYTLYYNDGELSLSLDTDTNNVWIFKSPCTTHCGLCSPCAPNAGDLEAQDPDGYEAYCPPPAWLAEPGKYKIWMRGDHDG